MADDFAPSASRADADRQHRTAERLVRGQGNHAGRQRMRAGCAPSRSGAGTSSCPACWSASGTRRPDGAPRRPPPRPAGRPLPPGLAGQPGRVPSDAAETVPLDRPDSPPGSVKPGHETGTHPAQRPTPSRLSRPSRLPGDGRWATAPATVTSGVGTATTLLALTKPGMRFAPWQRSPSPTEAAAAASACVPDEFYDLVARAPRRPAGGPPAKSWPGRRSTPTSGSWGAAGWGWCTWRGTP